MARVFESVLCPACLASNVAGEQCVSCRAPLRVGGRYLAREALAQRASARTLGGVDERDGSDVIIKLLGVSALSEWKELELFQRGIGVLRGLDHPGVPKHLDDGELTRGGETFYYWIQQRVPGRTLAEGLAAGQRWTEEQARALARAVLEILAYLQGFSPPIVHRDIKPSNVLQRPDGGFVLIDFDLVKDTLDPDGGATTALGTAGYAPLEQLMGRAVPASDLYGLGATLVAVLSRKSPTDLFEPSAGRVEFREHVRVSPDFASFIAALLEPDVTRRPADATAALARLDAPPPPVASPSPAPTVALALVSPPMFAPGAALAISPPTPAPALVPAATIPLVPAKVDRSAIVSIPPGLVESYKPPWWVLGSRLVLVSIGILLIPYAGWSLAGASVLAWWLSGFFIRYPVTLAPGRALFMGGLSNTDQPGRHWLRRRWIEAPYSIPVAELTLRWSPSPTRLDAPNGDTRWLELELEARVRPRSDDVGQFTALLKYHLISSYPETLGQHLRDEVMPLVATALGTAELLSRSSAGPVEVGDTVRPAAVSGLAELGWEAIELRTPTARLTVRTEDMRTEDRVRLELDAPSA